MGLLNPNIKKAVQLLEQSRYRMGVAEFVRVFVEHWAYQQTGLYPPSSSMPEDLVPVAMELSHHLSRAMKECPGDDVMGIFFSECGFYKQGLNFFPTPPELSRLVAALLMEGVKTPATTFYEPCMGTGSMALKWMMEKLEARGSDGLAECELTLEDVDRTMCMAALIQVANFLCNMEVKVKRLSITAVDVLSRKPRGLVYIIEQKCE